MHSLEAHSKHISLFLTDIIEFIILSFYHVYLFSGPICKDKLKGDANVSMGFIMHGVQVGQHLVGQIRHIYHVIWRAFTGEQEHELLNAFSTRRKLQYI